MIGKLLGKKKDENRDEKTLAGLSEVEAQALSPTVVKETVPGDKGCDDYYL